MNARAPAAAVLLVMVLSAAQGQTACPSGKTADGKCVNAPLTSSVQQRAIVFSQPNLSFLGPPLAYGNNSYIDASRDRQALSYIDAPGRTSSAPTPPAGTFIGLPPNVDPYSLNIAAPFTVVPGGIRVR